MLSPESLFLNGGTQSYSGCTGLVSSTDPFGDGSLIAKYELDGDATDTAGNYDGTASNVAYADGKFGQAGVFNGSTSYITTNLMPPLSSQSISAWFKTSTTGTNMAIIGAISSVGNQHKTSGDIVFTSTGKLFATLGNNTNAWYDNTSLDISSYLDGNWHMITNVLEGTSFKVYMDGTLIYTYTMSIAVGFASGISYKIGRWGDYNGYYFNGNIDQVEIYNRALTSDEVYQLYTQSAYCSDPVPDYIAYYPLTGTAEDVTGVYDGTENGGLTYVDDAERGAVASFDGNNDYISLPSDSIFGNTSTIKGFGGWFKFDAVTGSSQVCMFGVSTSTTTSGYYYAIQVYDNGAIYTTARGYTSSAEAYASAALIPDTNWHHMYSQVEDTGREIYLDGVRLPLTWEKESGGITRYDSFNVLQATTPYPYIGRVRYAYPIYSDGKISNLRIYDRVLSSTEISDIYNYESTNHYIPVDDGLIAYYPLNTNSMDNYYNQYDGTDTGVTYDGVSGSFSAGSTYIAISQISIPSTFSFSYWEKPSAISGYDIVFGSTSNAFVYIGLSSATTYELNFTSTFRSNGIPVAPMSNGTWFLTTFTYDGTNLRIYRDGVLQNTKSATYASFSIDRIGYYPNSSANSYNGNLSNIRIYDKTLTQEEITAIYNTELPEHS
jgi:hypothetical protein